MSSSSASKVGKAQPSLAGTKWALADNVKGKIPTLNIEGEKSAVMQDAIITSERQNRSFYGKFFCGSFRFYKNGVR
jgi:hypothetical protein